MMINESLKIRFRALVDPLKMSKSKCASMIGLSYQTFMDIYMLGKVPYIRQLIRIADYFNVSIDYLLGRTDAQ